MNEDEKEEGFTNVNGEIVNNNKNPEKDLNAQENKLYDESYQSFNPQSYDYFLNRGYYTEGYQYPNFDESEYSYSFSGRGISNTIKSHYYGNNNTIFEVNEENNKPNSKFKENEINLSEKKEEKNTIGNLNDETKNYINKENNNNQKENEKYKEIQIKSNNKDNIKQNNNIEKKINENNKEVNSEIKKKILINMKEINYKEIPLYVNSELNRYYIDEESICSFDSKNENNANNFPLVIINDDKIYNKFIIFLERNYKYREFNTLPILKKKLILSKDYISEDQYQEYHNLKNKNIKKFANITNSSETKVYEQREIDIIIKNINNSLHNNMNLVYELIDRWIHTIINLLIEFIQFKLKKISYFHYCNNCHFPFLYISDNLEEINQENNIDLASINNSINIYKDLIKLININDYNNKNKNPQFIINVIYYEENNNYENFSFEEEINGAFIPCVNMKSFEKIMTEIHDKNIYIYESESKININSNNNYMFELIIPETHIQKIFNYLINNNYFQFFKGICILIEEKENINLKNSQLFKIKKKYENHLKDLYIAQNNVIEFLKKEKEDIKHQNNKEYIGSHYVIDYINYLTKYYKLHQGASMYYNQYSSNSYQIVEKVFLDFLNSIYNFRYKNNKNKDIKEKNKIFENNKFYHIISLFDFIRNKQVKNIKNNDSNKDFYIKMKNIIQTYNNNYDSLIYDFNYWLNNLDQLAHQKICYFIGSLMFNIDNHLIGYKRDDYNIDNENNEFILYKEFSGNYIDLQFYERHKNKIITFASFLFCSEKLNNKNYIHKRDKYSISYRINFNLNNGNEYIPIIYDLFYSKIFQLFTFFKIIDIKIKNNIERVIIDLEPINKKEFLEIKLKENEAIYYNPNTNLMEPFKYENNFNSNNNSNINQSYFSNDNNQSNIYITSTIEHSKYLKYFNDQFNKNLNINMTSILLDNSNLKNIGLLVLSKIKFKELIVLNLDNNNISNLSPLKDCNFPKLKKLSLGSDDKTSLVYKIKDISPLVNCNFPDLFILNLRNNLINDISYLLFMNFPNLIILDLSYNKIQSIHAFSSVNFPKLETLDLCNNLIHDITPLVYRYGKRRKILKNIDNNSSINLSNISNILSNSVHDVGVRKKNIVLPNLKILKLKHNKLNIDEGYLMTIKSLRNRGVTIFK